MNPELIKMIIMFISLASEITPHIIKLVETIKDPDELKKLNIEAFQLDFAKFEQQVKDLKETIRKKEEELFKPGTLVGEG